MIKRKNQRGKGNGININLNSFKMRRRSRSNLFESNQRRKLKGGAVSRGKQVRSKNVHQQREKNLISSSSLIIVDFVYLKQVQPFQNRYYKKMIRLYGKIIINSVIAGWQMGSAQSTFCCDHNKQLDAFQAAQPLVKMKIEDRLQLFKRRYRADKKNSIINKNQRLQAKNLEGEWNQQEETQLTRRYTFQQQYKNILQAKSQCFLKDKIEGKQWFDSKFKEFQHRKYAKNTNLSLKKRQSRTYKIIQTKQPNSYNSSKNLGSRLNLEQN